MQASSAVLYAMASNFAQPHELIYALIWPHIVPTFKMIHRRGADRAQKYIAPIEHRELNDRPIEVVTSNLALLQQHCEYSVSEGFLNVPLQ